MEHDEDKRAIEAVIERQFGSLNWRSGASGNWQMFAADFFPGASLYPAARPAKAQTVEAFVERMKGLSTTSLRSFSETILGCDIRVFGNAAVAVVACEMTENDGAADRSVEMLLLVKTEGHWKIVSQAWDAATDSRPVPADLRRG